MPIYPEETPVKWRILGLFQCNSSHYEGLVWVGLGWAREGLKTLFFIPTHVAEQQGANNKQGVKLQLQVLQAAKQLSVVSRRVVALADLAPGK